jgi:hypothetical protein
MIDSIQDALDQIEGLRDEAVGFAETIADLNSYITEDVIKHEGRWTHDLLDAQAYAYKVKYALDIAYSRLEDEL